MRHSPIKARLLSEGGGWSERPLNKNYSSKSGILNWIISSNPNFKSQFDLNSYSKGPAKKKNQK